MELRISPRLESDIRSWCDANGIEDAEGYAAECVERQFNLDRYGDLNITMGVTPAVTEEKPKKKYTRKKKDSGSEISDNATPGEEIGTVIAVVEEIRNPLLDGSVKEESVQSTRKKRVLKSKS